MNAHWEDEKEAIAAIRDAQGAARAAQLDAERAEREADLERAAEIRYGHDPASSSGEIEATTAPPRRAPGRRSRC